MQPNNITADQTDSAFDLVPNEILLTIFSSLDTQSLASISRVSKRFNLAVNSNAFWRPYAKKNPPSMIKSEKEKSWLLTKYIRFCDESSINYDNLFSVFEKDEITFGNAINNLSDDSIILSKLYEHIKTKYAIDSKGMTERNKYFTILYWAIYLNKAQEAKKLIDAEVPLLQSMDMLRIFHDVVNAIRLELLCYAIERGFKDIVELFCTLGLYKSNQTKYQELILTAALNNRADILDILLKTVAIAI